MEQMDNTLNIVEGLKDKLTSKEYKDLMESLAEINKIKKDKYVKFMSVTAVADCVCENCEDECEYNLTHDRLISKNKGENSKKFHLAERCDGIEVVKMDVKTSLECFPHIRKVVPDDEDRNDKVETIPQSLYDKLKEDILLDMGSEVLVYLGDIE